jgi:hypothetical protein
MSKLAAILRTAVLLLLAIVMLKALPILALWSSDSGTIDKDSIRRVATAAWLAIGWVAIEAAASWVRVWLAARKSAKAAALAGPPAP